MPVRGGLEHDVGCPPVPRRPQEFVDDKATEPAPAVIGSDGHPEDLCSGRIAGDDGPSSDDQARSPNDHGPSVTVRSTNVIEVGVEGLVDVPPVLA